MKIMNLYRYVENDRVIITPNKRNENDVPSNIVRLVADENKVLTNGKDKVTVIDTTNIDDWEEIDENQENQGI